MPMRPIAFSKVLLAFILFHSGNLVGQNSTASILSPALEKQGPEPFPIHSLSTNCQDSVLAEESILSERRCGDLPLKVSIDLNLVDKTAPDSVWTDEEISTCSVSYHYTYPPDDSNYGISQEFMMGSFSRTIFTFH